VTRTQAGQSSVQISAIARSLTVLQISGPAQELIYSIDIGDYYPGIKWLVCDVKHSHLVPKLKTSGVTTPLTVCIHIGAT